MTLKDVYSAAEAAKVWGVGESTIRNYAASGKFGEEAKKSGGTWLVTEKGMEEVFGIKKVNK